LKEEKRGVNRIVRSRDGRVFTYVGKINEEEQELKLLL
jgi:hypothetical protein